MAGGPGCGAIRECVTTPPQLGIYGRSNGGVLTSVTLTQHPELIGGAVIEIIKENGRWRVVEDSQYAGRITPETEMTLSGPAAGHELRTHLVAGRGLAKTLAPGDAVLLSAQASDVHVLARDTDADHDVASTSGAA